MKKKPHSLCVVTVGLDNFILALDDGLKLVDIMSRAVPAEPTYKCHPRARWKLASADSRRAELAMVLPDDIEFSEDDPRAKSRAIPVALPFTGKRRLS